MNGSSYNEEVHMSWNRTGVSEYSRSESIDRVWACGKNILVSYGQKGVDGVSKWRSGTREIGLGRMDGVKVALGNRGMMV